MTKENQFRQIILTLKDFMETTKFREAKWENIEKAIELLEESVDYIDEN